MRRYRKRKTHKGLIFIIVVFLCFGAASYYALKENPDIGTQILQEVGGIGEVPYQEVSIPEEHVQSKYYYGQLGAEEQEVYKEIVQGLQTMSGEIYVHTSDVNRANELLQYALKDFPEIFWCEGGAESVGYTEGLGISEGYTVIRPLYTSTAEEKDARQAQIDATVAECLANVPADAGDYEKILYVYEYIVNNVDYDLMAEDNQNIYSVFANHRSVCAGYSKATQYLLERLGVFCTYVTGTTIDQESHAWNLVMCDGVYYYVDATWGDPVYQQAEGEEVSEWQNISYDYMCCNDEELFRTHMIDADVSFPACTSMDANYYVRNGMYYYSFDGQEALKAMNDTISSGGNPTVLKYASADIYNMARQEVLGDLINRAAQNLANMYGLSQVQYYYQDEEDLNKITIYWQYE